MNFKQIKSLISIIVFFCFLLSSCEDYEGNKIIYLGDPNYVSVASKDNGDVMVILYQKSDRVYLNVGYNDLYLYFRDTKKESIIKNINYSVKFYLENDTLAKDAAVFPNSSGNSLNLFKIPTYFTKPSSATNYWVMEVSYTFKNKNYTEKIQLEVGDNPLYFSFENNSSTFFINQIEPKNQKIGILDFDFVILKKENNSFSYFNDITCDIKVTNFNRETINNVAPTNQDNGYYKGTIYVPETGAWQVESNFYLNEKIIYKYIYPIFIKTEI